MKKIVILLLITLALFGQEGINKIKWGDLLGKTQTYDDPFKKLSKDQLYYLSVYANISQMQKQRPKRVNEEMKKELLSSKQWLIQDGVDVEGLLAKREYIKKMRKKEAYLNNNDLNNTEVEMSGYMLPLKFDGTMVNEFLLVPTIGACIHTPPPPPNQIVYVKSQDAIEVNLNFVPVTITGVISTKPSTNSLFLKDGEDDISSGYTLNAKKVVKFKK